MTLINIGQFEPKLVPACHVRGQPLSQVDAIQCRKIHPRVSPVYL